MIGAEAKKLRSSAGYDLGASWSAPEAIALFVSAVETWPELATEGGGGCVFADDRDRDRTNAPRKCAKQKRPIRFLQSVAFCF